MPAKKTAEKVTPVQQAGTNSDAEYWENERKRRSESIENRNKKITKILFFVSLSIFCLTKILSGLRYSELRYSVDNIIVSFVLSILTFGCCIAGLVLSTKQDSEALKLSSIAMFAAAFVLFIVNSVLFFRCIPYI